MSRRSDERRVLDEAGGWRAMTGVMAVMLFLTVLAAAAGLAAADAAGAMDRRLAGRVTVQLVDADATARGAAAARALAALRASPAVAGARAVPRAELTRLLGPWLGADAGDGALPVPALIDADLRAGASIDDVEAAVARVAPGATVAAHARWMAPVAALLDTLTWGAGLVVALMAGATAAVCVLAARGGLETHRATIEVMHMLGSTDRQVARLFQRRVAMDAGLGGAIGAALGLGAAALIGRELGGLGAAPAAGATLSPGEWIALALLPLGFVGLATAAARGAVLRALRRTL